jgi:hypothetical protein
LPLSDKRDSDGGKNGGLHPPYACWKEERALSRALTLQYDKVLFILEPSEQAKADRQAGHCVDYPDGRLAIRHRGVELAYRTFDKLRQVEQGAIAEQAVWARCWR